MKTGIREILIRLNTNLTTHMGAADVVSILSVKLPLKAKEDLNTLNIWLLTTDSTELLVSLFCSFSVLQTRTNVTNECILNMNESV